MTPELQSVRVVAQPESDPHLDHLGEYREDPGDDDRTIDRKARGDMDRGEYRYFVAEHADYAEEDYERAEKFACGWLVSYGIRAVATVAVNGTVQKLTTPGAWGIPSDADSGHVNRLFDSHHHPLYTASDADSGHVNDVAAEELHTLRGVLDSFGVDHPSPPPGMKADWDDDAPWSGTVRG